MTTQPRPVRLCEATLNALHHDELYDIRIGGFQDPLTIVKRAQTAQQVKENYNPNSEIYIAPSCMGARR